MFTKADILARLQNGDTVDEIAAEMAAALNEAEAEKKALDAELAAKEKEETRVLEAKRAAVNNMLDAVCDYLVTAGEGDLIEELKEIDTDNINYINAKGVIDNLLYVGIRHITETKVGKLHESV